VGVECCSSTFIFVTIVILSRSNTCAACEYVSICAACEYVSICAACEYVSMCMACVRACVYVCVWRHLGHDACGPSVDSLLRSPRWRLPLRWRLSFCTRQNGSCFWENLIRRSLRGCGAVCTSLLRCLLLVLPHNGLPQVLVSPVVGASFRVEVKQAPRKPIERPLHHEPRVRGRIWKGPPSGFGRT
jgi:hypothetical protein